VERPHFEWDRRKARENIAKHGMSFEEAMTVFGDMLGRLVRDERHSIGGQRFVLVGESVRHRLLVVMFTERDNAIRIVSARNATRRERSDYEEGDEDEEAAT
jgi:uncharacterized DUF497 family protein